MYCNVTLRRVRATVVVEKSNEYYTFWVCVCELRYPACNAHTPYYIVMWPVRIDNIVKHYHTNATISGKQLLNIKCVLLFSTTFVCNISHSKKNWERYDKKCTLVVQVPVIIVKFWWNSTFLDTFFIGAWRITFEPSTSPAQARGFTVVVSLLDEKSWNAQSQPNLRYCPGICVGGKSRM